MAEFAIQEAFRNGIAPFDVPSRNVPYMAKMANLIPETRAREVEWPSFPVTGMTPSGTWPFPSFARGESVTLLRAPATMYSINESTWVATELLSYYSCSRTTLGPSFIQQCYQTYLAEFSDCWFTCTGCAFRYMLPYLEPGKMLIHAYGTGAYERTKVQTIAKHDARLFLGGVGDATLPMWSDSRFELVRETWRRTAPEHVFVSDESDPLSAPNWIVWSEPSGGADDAPFYVFLGMLGAWGTTGFDKIEELIVDAIERRRVGFLPLPTKAAVYHLAPLGNDLIAYTGAGVYRIQRVDNYYDAVKVSNDVVTGGVSPYARGTALAASPEAHVYLTDKGTVCRLTPNEYRTFDHRDLFASFGSTAIVVRDPRFDHYFITDGSTCYVFAGDGLGGPVDMMPTSLIDVDGDFIGYAYDNGDTGIEIISKPFDGGFRHVWEVVTVRLATKDAIAEGWELAIDYRFDKADAWTRTTAVTVDTRGIARVKVSGTEFRVVLTHPNRATVDLDRIDVEMRDDGRRSIRKWVDA